MVRLHFDEQIPEGYEGWEGWQKIDPTQLMVVIDGDSSDAIRIRNNSLEFFQSYLELFRGPSSYCGWVTGAVLLWHGLQDVKVIAPRAPATDSIEYAIDVLYGSVTRQNIETGRFGFDVELLPGPPLGNFRSEPADNIDYDAQLSIVAEYLEIYAKDIQWVPSEKV